MDQLADADEVEAGVMARLDWSYVLSMAVTLVLTISAIYIVLFAI